MIRLSFFIFAAILGIYLGITSNPQVYMMISMFGLGFGFAIAYIALMNKLFRKI